jgi:hypothetical protein
MAEEKLTKEQQEVYDSLPKWIFRLSPQDFASEFTRRIMAHPNTQKILRGNEQVETKATEVVSETLEKEALKERDVFGRKRR